MWRMRRTGQLLAFVAALTLAAACGGGNSHSAASPGTAIAASASLPTFCAELKAGQAKFADQSGASDYAAVSAEIAGLVPTAPTEIKDDITTLANALRAAGGHPAAAFGIFLAPKFLSAASRFKNYAKDKCGIDSAVDHVGTGNGGSTFVTEPGMDGDTPRDGLPDACILVPQASATTLFGSDASRGISVGNLGRACMWVSTDHGVSQSLRVFVVADPSLYDADFHPQARVLGGVGDRGFVDTSQTTGVFVSVQKGNRVLQLEYTKRDAAGHPVAVSTLANDIVTLARRALLNLR